MAGTPARGTARIHRASAGGRRGGPGTARPTAARGGAGFVLESDQSQVTGNIAADMLGHTVTDIVARDNTDNGFAVFSSNNTISNSVSDGSGGDGFYLSSFFGLYGDNTLTDNVSVFSGGFGFYLEGDGGHYIDNIATECGDDGFEITGDKNVVRGNQSQHSQGDGFNIDGNENRLSDNIAAGDIGNGFAIPYTSNLKNRLAHNLAVGGFGKGFIGGAQTIMVDNASVANQVGGIEMAGTGAMVLNNTSVGNQGIGLYNSGSVSVVKGNRSLANDEGIRIGVANGAKISKNVAMGNLPDLHDLDGTCADHDWSKNVFSTHTPSCAN